MHIRSLILGGVVAMALSGAAFAQHTTTLTGSIFDGTYKDGPQTFVNNANPGGDSSKVDWVAAGQPPVVVVPPVVEAPVVVVPPVVEAPVVVVPPVVIEPPVVVDPVDPVEPTEPVMHPDHPEGGGTEVSLIGTVYEGFTPGVYTQIFAPVVPQYNFPGGVIDAIFRADGTATVWIISVGLPGQG